VVELRSRKAQEIAGMIHRYALLLLCVLAVAGLGSLQAEPDSFVVKPYVQLGDRPGLMKEEALEVVWHARDADSDWALEYRSGPRLRWRQADLTVKRVNAAGIEPFRVYSGAIHARESGALLPYRIKAAGKTVFEGEARTRKWSTQPYRFLVTGDIAAGTPAQKKIAYQMYEQKPDFVFIAGDIVYSRGRISEYRDKFWPVYNADSASPETGAPLLRSTLFIAAPGNHDIGYRNLEQNPDALGYFLFWRQPLNGPLSESGAKNTPALQGDPASHGAFLSAAHGYPRMANFSFDYANSHWTVLDGNPYVDWTDPSLRAWVKADLSLAERATWKFVAFHHPGFNSSKAHFDYQAMRVLSDVFEEADVDVVFAGHVHNYQRSYPLKFKPSAQPDGKLVSSRGNVNGELTLDKEFDGEKKTKPNGVIYIVTGAGGAGLYNPEQQDDPASWQPFTRKFVSKTHSITVVDARRKTLKFRQISSDGTELDLFTVTK
jgi:predicted phosphodiesterase